MKDGAFGRVGEKTKRCMILCGKHEGNGPLVRPKFRWEDDIKMDL
jgi:hypothetical protein